MSNPLVTINLVILNGEKYIRQCLDSVLVQTYPHNLIELNILDNGSTDNTKNIIQIYGKQFIQNDFARFNLVESRQNLGMWPGHEKLLKYSSGESVVVLSVDVILDKDFISNSVRAISKDKKIGAVQAKIYRFDQQSTTNNYQLTDTIDTCGFKIFRSRRIINIGHGEKDDGQFNQEKEIFAVEGAVPVFRKKALESIRIMDEIADHDLFWYAEDLDVTWRMRVFGWKQLFVPDVIAWHDRQTTKNLSSNLHSFREIRKNIPLRKRRLEWRNVRFTIIKNDYTINILRDLPHILKREIMMLIYLIIFEPKVLDELPVFLRLLPRILRKRREIMKHRVASSKEIRKWFI